MHTRAREEARPSRDGPVPSRTLEASVEPVVSIMPRIRRWSGRKVSRLLDEHHRQDSVIRRHPSRQHARSRSGRRASQPESPDRRTGHRLRSRSTLPIRAVSPPGQERHWPRMDAYALGSSSASSSSTPWPRVRTRHHIGSGPGSPVAPTRSRRPGFGPCLDASCSCHGVSGGTSRKHKRRRYRKPAVMGAAGVRHGSQRLPPRNTRY